MFFDSFLVVVGSWQDFLFYCNLNLNYNSHIHVSLRDETGKNIFGVSEDIIKSGGRSNAKYDDLKFISQEGEWFLGGVLDGISDGMVLLSGLYLKLYSSLDPL